MNILISLLPGQLEVNDIPLLTCIQPPLHVTNSTKTIGRKHRESSI